jgi:hypothetical protein
VVGVVLGFLPFLVRPRVVVGTAGERFSLPHKRVPATRRRPPEREKVALTLRRVAHSRMRSSGGRGTSLFLTTAVSAIRPPNR